jgi:cyclohexanone monooxygenase
LRKKYAEERDKRLRDDGNDQYLTLDGNLSYYKSDPYVNLEDRAPKTDHTLFTYVGGGFAGLCAGAGLVQSGIDPKDIRIVEKGGDVGGTWYWNRYPGAMCDTAALIYMPLLEETGHMPTEKYAHGPEILEQSQKIATKNGLYQNALLHTEVTSLTWEDELSHWRIRTSRGDNFTSKYLGVGTGPFVVPKLPGIPGIGSFKGHTFHTSRWDYEYTGGSAVHGGELSEAGGGSKVAQPLDKLSDKRVAIIGTGATAVQCVPHLAAACKELYVFQRTPSSVDVRGNKPTDRSRLVQNDQCARVAAKVAGELRGDQHWEGSTRREGPGAGWVDGSLDSDPAGYKGHPPRPGEWAPSVASAHSVLDLYNG